MEEDIAIVIVNTVAPDEKTLLVARISGARITNT